MPARHDLSPRALTTANRKRASVAKRRGTGLTRRVEAAIECLVWGAATSLSEAAEAAGLTPRAFRMALRKVPVLAFYKAEVEALRNGELAANLKCLVGIRDDTTMKATAAGQKARIEAIKAMAPPEQRPGINIGVGVAVTTPGYVIAAREDPRVVRRVLDAAGSSAHKALPEVAEVGRTLVDEAADVGG